MKTTRFLFAAVLTVLAFTFFGCSSGGDDDGDSSSSVDGGGNVGNAVGTWKGEGTRVQSGMTIIQNVTLVLDSDGSYEYTVILTFVGMNQTFTDIDSGTWTQSGNVVTTRSPIGGNSDAIISGNTLTATDYDDEGEVVIILTRQ